MMLTKATFALSILSVLVTFVFSAFSLTFFISSVNLVILDKEHNDPTGTRPAYVPQNPTIHPHGPFEPPKGYSTLPSNSRYRTTDLVPIPLRILAPVQLALLAVTFLSALTQFCADIALAVQARGKSNSSFEVQRRSTGKLMKVSIVNYALTFFAGLPVIVLSALGGYHGSTFAAFIIVWVILVLVGTFKLFTLRCDFNKLNTDEETSEGYGNMESSAMMQMHHGSSGSTMHGGYSNPYAA